MSSSRIPAEAWGEASRNGLKVNSALMGDARSAGIYLPRAGQSDLLVAIISPRSLASVAVRHPGTGQWCGSLTSTWVSGAHQWAACRDGEVAPLGADRDAGRACALITGITP